jgi:hypothetical protein
LAWRCCASNIMFWSDSRIRKENLNGNGRYMRPYADPQQDRIFVTTHGARIHDSDRRPAYVYVQGTLINFCMSYVPACCFACARFPVRQYFCDRWTVQNCVGASDLLDVAAGRDSKPKTACALTNHPSVRTSALLLLVSGDPSIHS